MAVYSPSRRDFAAWNSVSVSAPEAWRLASRSRWSSSWPGGRVGIVVRMVSFDEGVFADGNDGTLGVTRSAAVGKVGLCGEPPDRPWVRDEQDMPAFQPDHCSGLVAVIRSVSMQRRVAQRLSGDGFVSHRCSPPAALRIPHALCGDQGIRLARHLVTSGSGSRISGSPR